MILKLIVFSSFFILCFSGQTLYAGEAKKILFISAELPGIMQTGGLAAAVDGLATAVANHADKTQVDVLLPYYTSVRNPTRSLNQAFTSQLDVENGHAHRRATFSLHELQEPRKKTRTLLLQHEPFPSEQNYFDNTHGGYSRKNFEGEAFGALNKAQAQYILEQDYDLIILNDWHTSLVALFLQMAKSQGKKVPKVMTVIHNLGYQGNQWEQMLFTLGVPRNYYEPFHGIEAYGQMNFLKAGLQYSDLVLTVSAEYAKEITTKLYGAGLEGVLGELNKDGKLAGMLNGIIHAQWTPSKIEGERRHDLHWTFNSADLSGKAKGKIALQDEMNLPKATDIPVYVLTSRVAEQKGFEYLIRALDRFLSEQNVQIVLAGNDGESGRSVYMKQLRRLEEKYPDQFRYRAFSEHLERKLITYGDFFVNTPWYEPSGLNQMYAMLNGTLPIVTKVGGLKESVKETFGYLADVIWNPNKTSIHEKPYLVERTADSIYKTLTRSYVEYSTHPEQIQKKRKLAMRESHSWEDRVAKEFSSILSEKLGMTLPAKSSATASSCRKFWTD